jgi:tetratricopeptide (TPR) repeat protein
MKERTMRTRLLLVLGLTAVLNGCAAPVTGPPVAAVSLQQPCDVEAAHIADPNRYASGKSDEEIVPIVAVRVCSEATTQFPNEARFHFQLGRALLAMKRVEEATGSFDTAASLGSQPAKFYLANDELAAYEQSESPDHLERAQQLLDEAANDFPPAAELLVRIVFTTDGLRNPQVIQALHDQDFTRLDPVRILLIFYLNGIQKEISNPFNPDGSNCTSKLADPAVLYDLEIGKVGDPRNTLERFANQALLKGVSWAGVTILDRGLGGDPDKWIAYFEAQGERDARALIQRHGCADPASPLKKVYRGLVLYAQQKRPLIEYGPDLLLHGKGLDVFLTPGETISRAGNNAASADSN